jgi:pyridoxine 4-dehydrogenase
MDKTDQRLPHGRSTVFLLGDTTPVNRLGYGAMRLTGQPANFGRYHDWSGGITLLRRAVALGITLIDTAESYGPGTNEELIADALHPYPPALVIATKGGMVKESPERIYPDGSPLRLRASVEASLRRLRVEQIGLYQLHRPDPNVPLEESVGALARLQAEGKIHHIGLSNVSLTQLEAMRAIAPIAAVQNRYSVVERTSEDVLAYCASNGIAFLPYGPLGANPMRQGAPLAADAGPLAAVASQLGATPSQVALAWLLQHAANVVVIPGTTSVAHLEENVAATQLQLQPSQIAQLDALGV